MGVASRIVACAEGESSAPPLSQPGRRQKASRLLRGGVGGRALHDSRAINEVSGSYRWDMFRPRAPELEGRLEVRGCTLPFICRALHTHTHTHTHARSLKYGTTLVGNKLK